jgi:hypothetical protein
MHVQALESNFVPVIFSFISQCTEMLSLGPISDSFVQNATKHLWPSKSVGLDFLPSFTVEGSTEVPVPVVKFTFNLGVCQNAPSGLWK